MKMEKLDKRIPQRTCVGCRESRDKSTFIRLALQDGRVVCDVDCKINGRGAYICPNTDCFNMALKKRSIGRAFKTGVHIDEDLLKREIESIEGKIRSGSFHGFHSH